MHFIILKLNVHEIKLKLHSKIANFNYKVQNCKLHQNEIFDVDDLTLMCPGVGKKVPPREIISIEFFV